MKSKKLKEPFTLIPNRILNDKSMSLEAKGLLSIMLSNSEDWKNVMSEIYSRSSNGDKSQQRVFKELKKLGYVTQTKTRNPITRKFEWTNEAHLTPLIPLGGKPMDGNVRMEDERVQKESVQSESVEKGGNNNTNENNTDGDNNNPLKTNIDNTNKKEEIIEQEKKAPNPNTICISSENHTPIMDDELKQDAGDDLPF